MLIFKNSKFSNWHKTLSSPKIHFFLFGILGLMYPMITCKLKLKSSEKKIFQNRFIPKMMSLSFLSQKCTHEWQVNSICCKSSPYERAKEFIYFQFYYFPFKPEKNNNNKTHTHTHAKIKIHAFLNQFSIYDSWVRILELMKTSIGIKLVKPTCISQVMDILWPARLFV